VQAAGIGSVSWGSCTVAQSIYYTVKLKIFKRLGYFLEA
jgi:hypothetical protein